jgi:hypothetical protein
MNAATSNHPHRRRNTAITGAAIGAVVLAGAAAVALNVGILDAADDGDVGELAAAGDLVPADTQVVDIYVDDAAAPSTDAAATSAPDDIQEFVIDSAGTASVIESADGIALGPVLANPGWEWSVVEGDATTLAVSFTNGARTVVFTATLGPDGTLSAVVEEPIVSDVAAPPAAAGAYDDDEDDEDDDEYEHEDEEHEGREDDD